MTDKGKKREATNYQYQELNKDIMADTGQQRNTVNNFTYICLTDEMDQMLEKHEMPKHSMKQIIHIFQ